MSTRSFSIVSGFPVGLLGLGLIALASMVGCNSENGSQPDLAKSKVPQVFAVNYPLFYFAKRIGGKQIEVHFPVPEDASPANWNPSADDIQLFQNADLILLNGADYAKWTEHVSLPNSKLLNSSEVVADRYIQIEETVTHQHGPDGGRSDKGFVTTVWLDFRFAIAQCETIKAAYVDMVPAQAAKFEERYSKLKKELLSLDSTLNRSVLKNAELPLIGSMSHQYLAKRYELNFRSVN